MFVTSAVGPNMPIAKILVPLLGAELDISVLAAALAAARPFSAHVMALLVVPDPCQSLPIAAPLPGQVVHNIIQAAGLVQNRLQHATELLMALRHFLTDHPETDLKGNVGRGPAKLLPVTA